MDKLAPFLQNLKRNEEDLKKNLAKSSEQREKLEYVSLLISLVRLVRLMNKFVDKSVNWLEIDYMMIAIMTPMQYLTEKKYRNWRVNIRKRKTNLIKL